MENEASKPTSRFHPKRWFRRTGCCALLMIWFVLLLTPCFFVTLLVEKDVVLHRSSVPDHEFRVFILEDPDQRGLGFSRGSIVSGGAHEQTVCVVTSVGYLLWKGEAQPDKHCNCFERVGEDWSTTLAGGDADCNPRDFDFEETPGQ